MAKNDFWKNLGDFMTAVSEHYDEEQKKQEEEKAELRKEFEDTSERKVYNRGTVITAMAKLGCVSTPIPYKICEAFTI